MALDIKKILDDINPSKEVMKWIIVVLCALLSASFAYQYFFNKKEDKSSEKIVILEQQISSLIKTQTLLTNQISALNQQVKSLNIKLAGSIENLKNYTDKRLEFVVTNENSKNKKFILDVFEMSKINAEALIPTYAKSELVVSESIQEVTLIDSTTSSMQELEPIETKQIIQHVQPNDTPEIKENLDTIKIIPDTLKKPGILKRFINLF